jgi:hypothetical protein
VTGPGQPGSRLVLGGPVVEVRLSGELAACDVLTAMLAAFPGVAITAQSGPRRNRRDPGHRRYLTVRLNLSQGDL